MFNTCIAFASTIITREDVMSYNLAITRRQVLAGMTAAGLTTALYPRAAVSQDGKILRVRSYSDIQVLDPSYRKAAPEDDIMRNIFVGLIATTPGDEWAWELDGAASIEAIDDKHVAFTLREGMKWSDGFGEVTAEDVKYSYERIADETQESPYHGDWASLDHVEVKDKLSGVIVLKEPVVTLWTTTLPFGSGKIICKAATEAAGGRFEAKPTAQCGRYLLKEWLPKQRTVLVRNPDWPGDQPAFDEIHILPIEDARTAELGFEGGELDFTWVAVSSIARYQATPPKGGKLDVMPSLAYVWLGINQESPPFDNPLLRRAIQHGIDVDSVLEAAYFGVAEASTGIIAPGLIGHRDKNLYGYDPERARALLKEAGHEGGVEAKLDILNVSERLNAAQAIQANLADIGIEVIIQQHDSGTFWSLGDETAGDSWKSLQLLLGRFSMQPDPSWATEWFTPEQVGVWNWERFNSEEFGELHRKAKLEADPEKRHQMYVRMQDLMEESGSYVFLTHEAVGVLTRDTVASATMPNGTPIFYKFGLA
jgi:peptide/nickel transport system substrate-binding protein